jgi:hypothetical protein
MSSHFIVWLPKSNADIHYCRNADQWADLYSCPSNNNEVFTCGTSGTSGWSSDVCEQQLGDYTWVSGNVTVAQLRVASVNAQLEDRAKEKLRIAPQPWEKHGRTAL